MDGQGRDRFAVDHVMYRNSGDSVYGDKDRVVGYNAFAITRVPSAPAEDEHLFHFSAEDKRAMLAAARASIYSALSGL